MQAQSDLPTVAAIVPTRDRPALMERAVSAILNQDYAGHIQCVVVFDQSQPHELDVAVPPNRELLRPTESPLSPSGPTQDLLPLEVAR